MCGITIGGDVQRTMLRRSINVRSDSRDRRIALMDPRDAKVGYLHCFAIFRQQQIMRFDIAVNNAVPVCMPQSGTNLLNILDRGAKQKLFLAGRFLQIAAREKLENDVMKKRAGQIASCAVSESANDVRMPDAIKSYSLVLKILYKRPLEIRVEVILQENVQGLYHNKIVRSIRRGKDIPG